VNAPYVIHLDLQNLQIYMQKIDFAMKVRDYIEQ